MQCPRCRAMAPDNSKFCGQCGTELAHSCAADTASTTPESLVEKRQLTIVVCDIVGSTVLAARLDPEELRDVIDAFQMCCTKEIQRLGGTIAQFQGDGVLAYFGYPAAHEHDAERAIRSALAIVESVRKLRPASNVVMQTRVGIATGVVVVGDLVGERVMQENAAIGKATDLAAILQSLAEPDTIVIAPETYRSVEGLFEYRELTPCALEGFAEPVHLRQVLRPSQFESRFEARHQAVALPILGREKELNALLRGWAETRRGAGGFVLLTGEPGIGKSRLARAFQEQLAAEPYTRMVYQCSPDHQSSALYPIITHLQRALGLERADSPGVKLAKLETLLSRSSKNLGEDVALLAALLSIPAGGRYPLPSLTPQQLKQRTLRALDAHLQRLAAQWPLLMIVEDLHWIDPTSLELLSLTFAGVGNHRIMVLATARPQFATPWPGDSHDSIALARLDPTAVKAMVDGLAGGKPLPVDVVAQIEARTDGVPLFIEELTKTVLESGLLRETPERYELTAPLPALGIPSTLHASLLERLDRLASVKDVSQIAAAIGRQFSYPLLAATAALPEQQLRAALAQLVGAGLIFQTGAPQGPTYQFKHALVQDAAYASMMRTRRQQLHGRIARALEQEFADIVDTEPEIVAHHYQEAGQIAPAIDYWRKAGERALARAANAEAERHLRKGIELVQFIPDTTERHRKELDLLMPLGPAMAAIKGYSAPETIRVFMRLRDLLGESGTLPEQMQVLMGLVVVHFVTGEHKAAREVTKRCLELAERHQHLGAQAASHRFMGMTLFYTGDLVEARQHLERVIELSDHGPNYFLFWQEDDEVYALAFLSWTLWLLGDQKAALLRIERAHVKASKGGHVVNPVLASIAGAYLGILGADPKWAAAHADEALRLSTEHRLPNWQLWARFAQGVMIARNGENASGLAVMREAKAGLDAIGSRLGRSNRLAQLAAAHASLGEPQAALHLLDEALQIVEHSGERNNEAELHRLKGTLLSTLGKSGEAEASLQQALTVARRQQAKWWELRAATALARLWHDQGKRREARELLSPIVSEFSDTPDTADLSAAREVLVGLVV